MKHPRSRHPQNLPPEAEALQRLATGLAESGCRAEDSYWEQALDAKLGEVFEDGDEDALNAALDGLYEKHPRAYDVLADCIESRAEQSGGDSGTLLIAAPVLAWSRFGIPSGRIPATILRDLRVHLQAHVLADGARLALADMFFSPDQLPEGYCATARFAAELGALVAQEGTLTVDENSLPETTRFLSDTRYLIAAVAYRRGEPVFRWQEKDGSRGGASSQWKKQAAACLAPLTSGCAIELELPDAFFSACRQSDRASRPFSVEASVAFLTTTLETTPASLRAVVATFSDHQAEELRVGFTLRDQNAVLHGLVWPLLGPEDDPAEAFTQVSRALNASGVRAIDHLDQRFPLEYCDDCGAPMYPSPDGDPVHAELPEENAEQVPRHLH